MNTIFLTCIIHETLKPITDDFNSFMQKITYVANISKGVSPAPRSWHHSMMVLGAECGMACLHMQESLPYVQIFTQDSPAQEASSCPVGSHLRQDTLCLNEKE